MAEPVPARPGARHRRPPPSGIVQALAASVLALLAANTVVLAEHHTGRDFFAMARGGLTDLRHALADALDPNDHDTEVHSGAVDADTTTTGAPATTATTAAPATTQPAAAPTTTAAAPPATAATVPAAAAAMPRGPSLEEVVAELSAYVERERNLRFHAPVSVVRQDERTFRASLAGFRVEPMAEEARRVQGVYRALGLIGPGVDLAAEVRRLSTGSAPGYYDYRTDQLVVRDGDITPFMRKILVHELTNALHDQHYDIHRPGLRSATDESGRAFESLVAGTATRIETRYVNSLPPSERQAIEAEQRRLGALIPRDIAQAVLVSFGFPYTAGARFADALGDGRIEAAFHAPPTTTEQILYPEKYLAGEGPRPVPDPVPDGPPVRVGSLGQLMLSLMFAEVLEGGYAEAAADGWGGDRYAAWEQEGRTCVRLSVDMDNPMENDELAEALADWAEEQPGAAVEGTGPFMVTRCA